MINDLVKELVKLLLLTDDSEIKKYLLTLVKPN